MENLKHSYELMLWSMLGLAIIIWIILQFITPAYGMTYNKRWGISVNSKIGWFIMESPVFISMTLLYLISLSLNIKPFNLVTFIMFVLFQLHYFQRSFVFPLLMRSSSKMPISIIIIGFVFNTCNSLMQGGWLFYFCPTNSYDIDWLLSPQFLIGVLIFFVGMIINMHSDKQIRVLRKNTQDANYYLPDKALFKYINSANYFGEILEWLGFAILMWSLSGFVFLIWTMANIVPRAAAVYERYHQLFGEKFAQQKRYKIFPFIY